jgi:FkbM family methyltransferase
MQENIDKSITFSNLRYYFLFIYYKFRIIFDCKSGRGRLLLAEFFHIVNTIFHTNFVIPNPDEIHEITTMFGTFKFINDYYGYSILSPAFERPDKELLISQIRHTLKKNTSVLFLDIGAYVGDYSIGISHRIKSNAITTVAFEPDIDYYKLCTENMKKNGVKKYKVYNLGLGDKRATIQTQRFPTIPLSKQLTLRIEKMDSIIPASYYKKFDEIFLKIDIEGHEEETFEGAQNLLKSRKKIRLMIEDCVNPVIIKYLQDHNWKFVTKITPYDSFWELN